MLGGLNPYSDARCETHCESNSDCDLIYGESNGYCCLTVDSVKYSFVGTQLGTKECVSPTYDDRCTRPTSGTGTGGGGDDCDYSGCMEVCVAAGGSNCGEDCKCD